MAKTDKLGTVDSTPGNLAAGDGAPELVGPLVTVSQFVVETLAIPPAATRVSQFVVEFLQIAPAPTVISQFVVEFLEIAPSPTRVSQFVVEAIMFDPQPVEAFGGAAFAGESGGQVWIE